MTSLYRALGPEGMGTYEVEWHPEGPRFERVMRPASRLLVPGFVDLHIHGAFGIDFMDADAADMAALCEKLAPEGYEAFLPTTVASSPQAVQSALAALPESPLIAGFHLEGPFLSSDFPGAQPPGAIRDFDPVDRSWDVVLDDPRLRSVTLAPERPHALELIARLSQRGVNVAMGHSAATFDEARFGFEFGASHVTHLYNAMRPFHHREPGLVGYALLQETLSVELIYDRLHLSAGAVRLALRCKNEARIFAVSDSTRATGLPANQKFTMWGQECETGRDEVRLASGALAGSAITLRDAFQNLAEDFGEETAIRMCCLNPRLPLGRETPQVWIALDESYRVVERWASPAILGGAS